MKPPAPASRRAVLAGLLLAPGCTDIATPRAEAFTFQGGIGRNPGGPNLARYTDATGRIPRANQSSWWSAQYSVEGFSRLDEIFPANISPAPPRPSPWARAAAEPAITYDGVAALGAGRFSLDGYLARNPTTGLLIARRGEILAERYQYGRQPTHRLTSFSMAKTLVALLVGLALEDGSLSSIEQPAEAVVPELRGTEYGATPLRHLLTMSSGVAFREDYDGSDDSSRLSRLTFIGQSAGGAAVPPQFNRRVAPPGQRWNYASAETFVLALVLRRALGRPLAGYFAEKIWQPLGAEADASWLVDRSGLEIGYMGFNATLRDYARLGMMLAQGGQAGGRQLVPAAWLAEMTRPHFSGDQTGRWFGYGFQTWIFPEANAGFALLGVRGQALFVEPRRQLVLVHTAVRPGARGDPGGADLTALWRGLRRGMPLG